MPYIKKEKRLEIDPFRNPDYYRMPENCGELNYLLTMMIKDYLGYKPNYQDFNDVLGVLTAMQHEIYRRMIAPYEDKKIEENGDVF